MKKILNYCIWALLIASLAACLPDPQIKKAPKLFLKIWINSSSTGISQLYWPSRGDISEEKSDKSALYTSNKWITQKFLLPNSYETLRFDPLMGSGSFQINNICIVDIDDKKIRDISLSSLKALNQVNPLKVDDKTISITTIPEAADPAILIEDSHTFRTLPWHVAYSTNIKTFLITFFVIVVLGCLADFSEKHRCGA